MIYKYIAKLDVWERKLILIFIDFNILIFAVWLSFWLRLSEPFSIFFLNEKINFVIGFGLIFITMGIWLIEKR